MYKFCIGFVIILKIFGTAGNPIGVSENLPFARLTPEELQRLEDKLAEERKCALSIKNINFKFVKCLPILLNITVSLFSQLYADAANHVQLPALLPMIAMIILVMIVVTVAAVKT